MNIARRDLAVAGLVLLAALIGYAALGRPFMADEPYSKRMAELAARDPMTMTAPETLARLETMSRENPDAAEPHFFIGEVMRAQGRDEDAVRAYRSALRRDDAFVPALAAFGDSMVRLEGGEIGEAARSAYLRAFEVDQTQTRAGFMAGLGSLHAGDEASAERIWADVRLALSANPDALAQLEGWIAAANAQQAGEQR